MLFLFEDIVEYSVLFIFRKATSYNSYKYYLIFYIKELRFSLYIVNQLVVVVQGALFFGELEHSMGSLSKGI